MSLLTRQDWEELRNRHRVAFTEMPDDFFELFLDKVFGNAARISTNKGKLDSIDALMIVLSRARTEPPIPPPPPPSKKPRWKRTIVRK